MGSEQPLWGYFFSASPVVKLVMVLLLVMSMLSWTVILQRGFFLKRVRTLGAQFEELFWSGIELNKLYTDLTADDPVQESLSAIFQAGFREFIRLRGQVANAPNVCLEGVQRAMRIAHAQATDSLERQLTFLASIGSTSPYVGLFGTVWGIMASFQSLSTSRQAVTMSLVAPGISEALVATALGLFAAIPAIIFYNHYVNTVDRLLKSYDIFQEEFISLLYREIHGESLPHAKV